MKLYDALYHNLPCICITTDSSGAIIDLNQMGRHALGYSPQALIGTGVFNLFQPADRSFLQSCLKGCLAGIKRPTIGAVRLLVRDGGRIWVRLTLRILPDDASSQVVAFFCEDLSEFKQLQATLHNKTQEIQLLTDALPDKSAYVDVQQRYQFVNKQNIDLERQVLERTAQLQQALDFEATLKRIADKVRDSLDENGAAGGQSMRDRPAPSSPLPNCPKPSCGAGAVESTQR